MLCSGRLEHRLKDGVHEFGAVCCVRSLGITLGGGRRHDVELLGRCSGGLFVTRWFCFSIRRFGFLESYSHLFYPTKHDKLHTLHARHERRNGKLSENTKWMQLTRFGECHGNANKFFQNRKFSVSPPWWSSLALSVASSLASSSSLSAISRSIDPRS